MIPLVAVIGAATAAGIGAERRFDLRAEVLARKLMWIVLWVLMPVVVFINMRALHITAHVGAGIGFAYVALVVTLAVAWFVGKKVLCLSRASVGTLMNVSFFGNTGYLGLPFTAALLGFSEVPNAVAYDTLVSTLGLVTVAFSVGAAFGTVGERLRDRFAAFFLRNPPLWATVLGLVAPHALAPHWAVQASRGIVVAILPIGFFAVGVTLAAEAEQGAARFPPPMNAPVACAVAFKLLLPPAIVLGLSALFISVPHAYLTQAAMATGINNLVVAHEYGLDRGLAASAIAWTTAIVSVVGVLLVLL